jgi:hypothetical protein
MGKQVSSTGKKGTEPKPGYAAAYAASLAAQGRFETEQREALSRAWSDPIDKTPKKRCPRCGNWTAVSKKSLPRAVTTRYGETTFTRHYYWCGRCEAGFFPKDAELGFEPQDCTPDVAGWAEDLCMNDDFRCAAERLRLHHGIAWSLTGLQGFHERQTRGLVADGKPEPVAELPLTERNMHQPVTIQNDGSMILRRDGWHEVKLFSVGVLGETKRVYLAETASQERFEAQLRQSPGFWKLRQRTVLWLGDGAPGNWKLQQRLCPQARPLLDLWHAMEHAFDAAKAVLGEGDACVPLFAARIKALLLSGDVDALFDELKECIPYKPKSARKKREAGALWALLKYLQVNRKRLNYKEFLANKWPLGSGEIESAHRHVIQRRMKQAGMRWSPDGAQRMAQARALYASVGPEAFHEALRKTQRLAA